VVSGLVELSREELIDLVVELREVNAGLAERVRRLERLVSRNSGNSSMPPSSDDVPGRKKPAPKRASKKSWRSRGKQPGAGGAALSWVAEPDETVPHRPDGRCGCGADLAGAAGVRVERSHQVHDLPRVEIKITQHDVWRVRCGCGAEHAGELPPDVSAAPSSYGPNLKTLVGPSQFNVSRRQRRAVYSASSRHRSQADCRLTPSAPAMSVQDCPWCRAVRTALRSAVSSRARTNRMSSRALSAA
jgi:hypothetical protein